MARTDTPRDINSELSWTVAATWDALTQIEAKHFPLHDQVEDTPSFSVTIGTNIGHAAFPWAINIEAQAASLRHETRHSVGRMRRRLRKAPSCMFEPYAKCQTVSDACPVSFGP